VAELRFSMETHGTAVVVSAHGELDITSSQRFDDRLSEAAAASDQVILDMSAVDFMDTTALAVIVTHWRRQAEEGGVFLLAGARYRYTKALWITGLADRLPMYETVGEAVAALAGTGGGGGAKDIGNEKGETNSPGTSEPGDPEASAG
jgi:anti-sigma B factor antagonist